MKTVPRRLPPLSIAFLASAALAQAHPGHDGGHELTWDFEHLAAHPGATLGWALVLATGAWIAARALTAGGEWARQSLRGSQRSRGK
ncbi:MAG TPA: hypothetical protein VHD62_12855 [Opitutaceae bacterium]|nr:hypothetical protein [Opitutaceae bacterium]